MAKTKSKLLTDADGEVRELTNADFARAKPFTALSRHLQEKLRQLGRQEAPKAVATRLVSLRLSVDVLQHFNRPVQGGRRKSMTP